MLPRADALLFKALDGEALYTIAADLKPLSSGFVSMQIKAYFRSGDSVTST